MCITISFVSLKGGVGKSSLTMIAANCFAAHGKKVLVVDLDTNNSSTFYYTLGLFDSEEEIQDLTTRNNIFEALTHRNANDYIIHTNHENVDLLASTLQLSDIRSMDYKRLKSILPVDKYDVILIDTAPTYDNHTQSAIYAADHIFTPLEFSSWCYTTSKYLRTKIIDEFSDVNKIDNWYLVYAHWNKNRVAFSKSMQMQFTNIFENEFDNILSDVTFPHTTAVDNYTQMNEKLRTNGSKSGNTELAVAMNKFVKIFFPESTDVEVF